MKKPILVAIALSCASALAGNNNNSGYSFNPKVGISPYTGILGLEVQKNHWSLGLGLPGSISVKHYVKPNADSLYYGVYLKKYSNNNYNEVQYGVLMDRYERKEIGIGAGYTWVWPSGWNTSAGLSVGDLDETYSNANVEQSQMGQTFIGLELTVGHKFNFAK